MSVKGTLSTRRETDAVSRHIDGLDDHDGMSLMRRNKSPYLISSLGGLAKQGTRLGRVFYQLDVVCWLLPLPYQHLLFNRPFSNGITLLSKVDVCSLPRSMHATAISLSLASLAFALASGSRECQAMETPLKPWVKKAAIDQVSHDNSFSPHILFMDVKGRLSSNSL